MDLDFGMKQQFIQAELPDCANVSGVCTCRLGGISKAPYGSLNLGLHVGDEPSAVEYNRQEVLNALPGLESISWMNQIHSCEVNLVRNREDIAFVPDADAQVTSMRGVGLAVMTADCLPVLLTAEDGSVVGAAHGGWRGLYGGIITKTLEVMNYPANKIWAWLGPCIGSLDYEVGDDMYSSFIELDPRYATCFKPSREAHWYADLQGMARLELAMLGVEHVSGCSLSTYSNTELLYSYRREKNTGRMASIIWIK